MSIQASRLHDCSPQVGGAVSAGIRGVARAEVAAPVERQEPGAGAGQAGGHHHRGRIDREVRHAHPAQGPVVGRPVAAVLGDGVLDALTGQRVLQFGGGDGHPVDEHAQIDGPASGRIERQLPGNRQHVGLVEGRQLRGQPVRGPEVRQPDGDVAVDHPAAQHIHGAPLVEFRSQTLHEPGLRLARIAAVGRVHESRPFAPLRSADELEQVGRVDARLSVEVPRPVPNIADLDPPIPAVLDQPARDMRLERRLGDRTHAATLLYGFDIHPILVTRH